VDLDDFAGLVLMPDGIAVNADLVTDRRFHDRPPRCSAAATCTPVLTGLQPFHTPTGDPLDFRP
jgi:hypothetical protein